MVALVLFPALALMNRSFAKRMEVPARRAQERIGEVSAVAHESIDGAIVVKTLGREEAEIERLAVKARALRDDRVEAGFIRATFEAALDALPALAAALLLAVGSWRVSVGAITLGELIGFVALFNLLAWPMRFIGWILAELPRAVVGYARLEEVFAEPVTVLPAVDPVPLPDGPLGLEADDVRHVFDGITVLDGVSLRIEAAGVGGDRRADRRREVHARPAARPPGRPRDRRRSASAGSTSATPTRHSLRRAVSIVFQESFLFATTFGDNIALDSEADRDAVERAARIAAADRVHPRAAPPATTPWWASAATRLSGGQRQRVALARAIVREPRLLILDDATSSVDPSVEAQILAALREELHTTLVVIAYRLSTIRLADRVIFLERGRVSATGTHDELLGRGARLRGHHPRVRAGRAMSAGQASSPRTTTSRSPSSCSSSFAVLRRGMRESPELRAGLLFTVIISLGVIVAHAHHARARSSTCSTTASTAGSARCTWGSRAPPRSPWSC